MSETKSNRLRNKVLGADPSYRKVRFTVDGEEFEVREMSLATTRKIEDAARNKKGKIDGYRMLALAAIESVYDPTTGQKVLESTDEAKLLQLPSNSGFFHEFGKAFEKLKPGEVSELEGNSEAAPGA